MYDFDTDPQPEHNKPLIRLYEKLCALLTSLPPDIHKRTLKDRSGERFNTYIDQLTSLVPDGPLDDFKVEILTNQSTPFVMGEAYIRQLSALTRYLYKTNPVIGYYCAYPPEGKFSKDSSAASPPTTVNNHLYSKQESTQTTTINIEFTQTVVSLAEALTRFEANNPDPNSKENVFARTLKKSLPMVKDTLGIIALTLKIAGDVDISPHISLKALGLDT